MLTSPGKPVRVLLLGALAAGLVVLMGACDSTDPVLKAANEASAPDPVTNVQVENTAGGAVITYDLPDSDNLSSVVANFSYGDDQQRQARSSSYDNELVVDGFPEAKTYTGQIYAESEGGKQSEAVDVTIEPEPPAYLSALEKAEVRAAFGGVIVDFENPSETSLAYTLLAEDSLGQGMTEAKTFYTDRPEGAFSLRGRDADQQEFALFVRDQWDHVSDTMTVSRTPLFEEKADKSLFATNPLPTDVTDEDQYKCGGYCGFGMADMWDGQKEEVRDPVFITEPGTDAPLWFTIDLGQKVQLSRFKLWSREDVKNGAFESGDPKILELYGTNDPPSDGSFDGWTKLGKFEAIKPSGEGPVTQEDIRYASIEGREFIIEDPTEYEAFRYVRIKVLETWTPTAQFVYIAELSFFGRTEGAE
jgi:hypothetical protein